jgi:signal transduction histidine kinase
VKPQASTPAPGFVNAARRRFDGQTLPAQIAWAGAIVAAALIALARAAFDLGWPISIALGASTFGASLVAASIAARVTRALRALASAALTLGRQEALGDDDQLPLLSASAELRDAAVALRLLVDGARRYQRVLEAQNAVLTRHLQSRTHELSTLHDLSLGLAAKSDLQELVGEALHALEQTMDYSSASLWMRSEREAGGQVVLLGYRVGKDSGVRAGSDLTGMRLARTNLEQYQQIERERQPLIENHARQSLFSWLWSRVTEDARSTALYRVSRSWMAVPLKFRDVVLGVMRIDHQEPEYFDEARARLLSAVSSQTALAMRHAQLQAQEKEIAVTAERNRIARDLHDAVSQTLFAASVTAGTLAKTTAREPPPAPAVVREQAAMLEKLTRVALAEMRLLMFELRPDALQGAPLAELLQHAIEALSIQGSVKVEAMLARDDRFAAAVRVPLYRIAQEALSNISRHSGAANAVVEWSVDPVRGALLRIADDGNGFDPDAATPGHFGLESMRSRAREIGARLEIASTAGNGAELRVELAAPTELAA